MWSWAFLLLQLWELRNAQGWSSQDAPGWCGISWDLCQQNERQVKSFFFPRSLVNRLVLTCFGFFFLNIHILSFFNFPSRSIYKWWAQYLESQSDMDTALLYYERAEDFLSLVRVYCYIGNIQKVAPFLLFNHYEAIVFPTVNKSFPN